MPVENNQIIAEWLGLCWHEGPLTVLSTCGKCGQIPDFHIHEGLNPDFTTFAGMEVLLKGLEEKGVDVSTYSDHQTDEHPRYAKLYRWSQYDRAESTFAAKADTLPLALTEAVLKLIEQGEIQQQEDKQDGR